MSTRLQHILNGRLWWLIPVMVMLCLAAYSATHRQPWSDEGWFSSAAENLANRGVLGTTVLEPGSSHLTRIDQRTYWVMPLYLIEQAAWYRLMGASLMSTRMLSAAGALLALAAFFCFLRDLSQSQMTARLGTALLASSYIFIDNAGFGRPDMLCCAFGLLGLACYWHWREKDLSKAIWTSNLCVTLACFQHPNGIYHFAGLAYLILSADWRRLRVKHIVLSALPYLAGLGLWGLYIAQDPQAFSDQMRSNGTNGRWPANWNPASILWNEIRERYLVVFGLITRGSSLAKAYALLLYLLALGLALFNQELRERKGTIQLLSLLGVYFVFMSVFNQKLSYYLIHILPFFIALLATAACWIWSKWKNWRIAIGAALVLLALVECGGILWRGRTRSYREAETKMVNFLLPSLKPTDRIIGSAALLYGLNYDKRLLDDPYLGINSGKTGDWIVVEPLYRIQFAAWETEKPSEMAKIRREMEGFEKVHEYGGYEVYKRRNRSVGF